MNSQKLTTQVLVSRYQQIYNVLAPDSDSVAMTKQVWEQWEKAGLTRPDIDQIARDHKKHELGLFYDIVKAAEGLQEQPLNISYVAFCLDRYNFYALTTEDGYIVLVDESFFQLLFFFTYILMLHAQGIIKQHEMSSVSQLCRDVVKNNYFQRKQFDFAQAPIFYDLLGRHYETSEVAGYLFQALKIFILAHEIGHHVLGHTQGNITCNFGLEKSQSVAVDSRRIASEFEADHYAHRLLSKINATVDGSLPYALCHYCFDFAPLLLFDIFRLLDELHAGRSIKEQNPTHPPSDQRWAALQSNFSIPQDDPLYLALTESIDFVKNALAATR